MNINYCFVVDLKMVNFMVYTPHLGIFSRMEEGGRERSERCDVRSQRSLVSFEGGGRGHMPKKAGSL